MFLCYYFLHSSILPFTSSRMFLHCFFIRERSLPSRALSIPYERCVEFSNACTYIYSMNGYIEEISRYPTYYTFTSTPQKFVHAKMRVFFFTTYKTGILTQTTSSGSHHCLRQAGTDVLLTLCAFPLLSTPIVPINSRKQTPVCFGSRTAWFFGKQQLCFFIAAYL